MLKENIHQTPFIRFIAPVFLGILFKLIFTTLYIPFLFLVCLFIILLFSPIFLTKYLRFRFNWYFGILLNISFFSLGVFITQFNIKKTENVPYDHNENIFIGVIKKSLTEKPKSYQTVIVVESVFKEDKWIECENKVNCYLEKDSLSGNISIGDLLIFKSKIKDIDAPKNPKEFNYKQYQFYKGIKSQTYINSNNYSILESNNKFGIYLLANNIREYLLQKLKEYGIKEDEFSVVSALSLGYKESLRTELKQGYINSGAIHILAVSGLHVGIIYVLFNYLLSFLNKNIYRKIIKALILISVLWFYAIISGLSPSVIRASVMFSIIIVGKSFNRTLNIYNTIAASAFIILLLNPFAITQVSFQLSYLAVLGIVYIHKRLYNSIHSKYWIPDKIWMFISISIAAQLATFPLTIYYFHQFPNYFLITNIVIIPLATVILCITIAFFTFSFIPAIATALGIILSFTVKILNNIIFFVSELPYSQTHNIYINTGEVILLFIVIISLLVFFHYKRISWIYLSLTCISVLIISNIINKNISVKNDEILVYSIKNSTAINFLGNDYNILLTDSSLFLDKKKLDYHLKNYWIHKGIPDPDIYNINNSNNDENLNKVLGERSTFNIMNNIFVCKGKAKIGIINNKNLEKYNCSNKLKLDYLIITSNIIPNFNKLNKILSYDNIILDSSFSFWEINKIRKNISDTSINLYNTNNQGYITL